MWRYGISKREHGGYEYYALVEKYNIAGDEMETADAITFTGDTPAEIIRSLERALADVRAEIVTSESDGNN
jgi:hypothetical protein